MTQKNRTAFQARLNRLLPIATRTRLRELALLLIPSMRHLDMWTRLRHLAHLGFRPKVIFDVGASQGEWARQAMLLWPESSVIGFEPNASRVAALEQLKTENGRFSYFGCFLGSEGRPVKYRDRADQTSVYYGTEDASSMAQMEILSALVERESLAMPNLIKLDVQGAELDVLRGAEGVIASTEVVLSEVSLYRLSNDMPTAFEVWEWMKGHGFALYDIVSALRRPTDDALLQMDFVFVRQTSPLFRDSWD